MKRYTLGDIPPDSYFTQDLFLDEKFILATPEMPFSQKLKDTIAAWRFKEVFSDGEPQAEKILGTGGDDGSGAAKSSPVSDGEKIKRVEQLYLAFQKYAESLFAQIRTGKAPAFKPTAEKIKAFCGVILENQRYFLRVLQTIETQPDQDYLASHAVRSAIIAIITGSYLKLSGPQLIELGVAALFHEVGMLELPPQIILSERPLTPQEQQVIQSHTIRGYKILKVLNFPPAVSIAALDHHERENGSGYPRQLSGRQIGVYSKIIAVACSWAALSVKRPYREAKDGYTGIVELLRNEGKPYNDAVIRALVYSLSIYPIGLYVLLSNGKRAQVVDVNPKNPRYPIVQLLEESAPDGKNNILETSEEEGGVFIISSLTHEEAGV